MSKKQKRKVSRPASSQSVNQYNAPVKTESAVASPSPVVRRSTTVTYSSEFNPDYTLVLKDLKRIGILAGSFFTVLVILSFFLK